MLPRQRRKNSSKIQLIKVGRLEKERKTEKQQMKTKEKKNHSKQQN
jgi:hypothetical protein